MKKYELMALPYAPEALEPVISKETIGHWRRSCKRRLLVLSLTMPDRY